MRKIIFFAFLITNSIIYCQNQTNYSVNNRIIEDKFGKIITNENELIKIKNKKKKELQQLNKKVLFSPTSTHLCDNYNFEEYQIENSELVLSDYQYTILDPINPTQCSTPISNANTSIKQYNPNNNNLMATSVPSNYNDEFIGNINAFDQYALKINFKESSNTSSVVQAKRFKTNNENQVIINYKTVLQSIEESGHLNEQPFIKFRAIKSNGTLIDEFCLIGDPTNCIFTQAPNYEAGSVVLYTKNWQTAYLNISSIPNNEEFVIEMTAARCGLGGHFGYAYIDDLCLVHSNENLQGSIELDPLFKVCPDFPLNVCGKFTIPNSGGISANVGTITLKILDSNNNIVYTSTTPTNINLTNNTFCFSLTQNDFPNITSGNYNISATINFTINQTDCTGTTFNGATDPDANIGWDVSFLNCNPNCNIQVQTGTLKKCDSNNDGKEFFNLTLVENQIIGTQTGLTISYFTNSNDAFNNTNPITNATNFESYTSTIYVRVSNSAACYKIIAFQLFVKNPFATISGILNICNGSTTLTANTGTSYLWSTGATTQSINVNTIGNYSVTVTDIDGCISSGNVTILPSQVAVSPDITVIQPSCNLSTGTITITSPAAEYSFDGGTTWTTNNSMNNLPIGTYNIKIKTINNCLSYNSVVNIVAFQSDYPDISFTQPTSCNDLGSITITTVAHEYSFDDGITWTTNNTATNLPMGTYKLRTRDANGCVSNFNNVVLYGEFLSAPIYNFSPPYCSQLGSIIFTSIASEYSIDGGTTWQNSNVFNNLTAGSYVLKIKDINGCTSPNTYVYLNNLEDTYPLFTISDAGCNTYASITINTLGDEYSFDGGLTWSNSNVLTNLQGGGSSYQLVVKKGNNCISNISNATIYSSFLPLPNVTNYNTLICDNNNNNDEPVDLTSFNQNIINNYINFTFNYYLINNSGVLSNLINNPTNYLLNNINQTIYIEVTDNNNCKNIAELYLTLIPTPIPTIKSKYYICENHTLTLTENHYFDSYLWSTNETTPIITISQDGIYSLTVTENHNTSNGTIICSTTKDIQVILSNPATFTSIITSDWTDVNNVLTINVDGLGNYEYSINGIDYQESNIFSNLEPGEYTIFVRDKNGCGIVSEETYLLMHPLFFTPNNDGYNDTWQIYFSKNEPKMEIKIFDRYGKFIKQISPLSQGWDGTYNGQPLPSNDYWFTVKRENGKIYKGHFSLKR